MSVWLHAFKPASFVWVRLLFSLGPLPREGGCVGLPAPPQASIFFDFSPAGTPHSYEKSDGSIIMETGSWEKNCHLHPFDQAFDKPRKKSASHWAEWSAMIRPHWQSCQTTLLCIKWQKCVTQKQKDIFPGIEKRRKDANKQKRWERFIWAIFYEGFWMRLTGHRVFHVYVARKIT